MANTFTFANQTLTDADIFGGINYMCDLNTGDEFSIGNTASACVSFVTDKQIPLYTKDQTNGFFSWTQDLTARGTYYVTEVTKVNGSWYNVTAYDAMILLDTSITALSLTFPLTVSAAASAIATYLGCSTSGTIYNGTQAAQDGTIEDTTTIRQLLGWVAEASGASVKIDASGDIAFLYYASSGITVTASDYIEDGLDVADYTCAAIDNVTICDMAGMTAATSGAGTNSLFIQGNPFLYEATNTEAAVILGLVDSFVYAPFTCQMFDENGLDVGVTATFGTVTSLVMHIESSESGAIASAVGSDSRAEFNKSLEIIVNEALAVANDAQQTAQDLNLHFWYTASGAEAGAHIAEVDKPTFETTPSGGNLLSNSTGIKVRDGLTELATFGASGETIGVTDGTQSYLAMDYHSMRMIDKEGNPYFYVSDLRDVNGDATVTSTLIGDGTKVDFSTDFDIKDLTSVTNVTINGTATTAYTVHRNSINAIIVTFTTAPADGAVIEITYISQDTHLKAYTLGLRNSSGVVGGMSVVEGAGCTASGDSSHAEGKSSVASGNVSHAEGYLTTASGNWSHAEGQRTKATDQDAHAEGVLTEANGMHSHAEGRRTVANGMGAHAGGYYTIADYEYQTAIGQYNEVVAGAGAVIIGCGTSTSNRKNSVVIQGNGVVHLYLDTNQASGTDHDIYTALTGLGWASNVIV